MKESIDGDFSKKLETIIEKISANFEKTEKARDEAYQLQRKTIQKSSLAIRAIHRNEIEEAKQILSEAKNFMNGTAEYLKNFPAIYYTGFLHDAQKEYAEAAITIAIIAQEELPDPETLGVENPSYCNALGEVVGELRRYVMDSLRSGRCDKGEKYLNYMEEIYHHLTAIDFSDAITKGLRRTTDVTRSILEKTRGDLTNHLENQRLISKMEQLNKNLSERES